MNRKIGVIFSYLLMFVEVFSAMLFTPLLIRSLGPSEYGVYQLVSSVTAYLMLLDLGVGNAIIRYIAKFRAQNDIQKQREILGIAIVFYSVLAILILIAGGVLFAIFPTAFAQGLTLGEIELARKLLCINIINVAFSIGSSAFGAVLFAYEQFALTKGANVITLLLKMGISIGALCLGFKSVAIMTIALITNVALKVIYIFYVYSKFKIKPIFKNLNFGLIKETISYSAFILLQMIATQINVTIDSVLLGALTTASSVIIAIYGTGNQIIQYFKTIGGHFTGVLMAGVVRLVESGAKAKELQNEMIRIGRIILLMLGMVFTVFLVNGKHFMILWVGENYRSSYMVAIAIMIPTMFTLIQSIGTQILWAMNKHKTQAIIQIISAIIHIVISVVLIKLYALEGAVISCFMALMIGDVICMNVMFKREIKISLIGYFKGLFKGILPALTITGVSGVLFNLIGLERYGWFGFILNCAVMVAVYAVCVLTFGMNQSEKNMIFGILNKILKKFRKVGEH